MGSKRFGRRMTPRKARHSPPYLIECGNHGKRRWKAVCLCVIDRGAPVAYQDEDAILCERHHQRAQAGDASQDEIFPVCFDCLRERGLLEDDDA